MHSDFSVGVHALIYLQHKKTYIQSNELSNTICTNPSRVRKVMTKLSKANLVTTKEGLQGGYKIIEKDITLKDVILSLETPVVDMNWVSGSMDNACKISRSMQELMDGLLLQINESVLETLSKITIASLERKIQNENI